MGKKSRDKGAAGERELVRLLKDHGLDARRTAMMQTQDASFMPDVLVTDWPEVWIECKREKRCSPRAAYLQGRKETVRAHKDLPQHVLAITRSDRSPWMVYGHAGIIIRGISSIAYYSDIDIENLHLDHWYQKVAGECQPNWFPVLLSPHPDRTSTAKMAYLKLEDMLQLPGWGDC